MLYLLSYDIESDVRRGRMFRLLSAHGLRVQKSVFELELSATDLKRLLDQADKLILRSCDSLRVYMICGECREKVLVLGSGAPPQDPEKFFIV